MKHNASANKMLQKQIYFEIPESTEYILYKYQLPEHLLDQ